VRAAIGQHLETFLLHPGEGLPLSNTRWLHGRDRYTGRRVILGDPRPGTGVKPGFPSPATMPRAATAQAA
jgi:hypothetical protein